MRLTFFYHCHVLPLLSVSRSLRSLPAVLIRRSIHSRLYCGSTWLRHFRRFHFFYPYESYCLLLPVFLLLHLGWALRNPTGWVCWAIVGRSSIWFPRLQRSISFVEWHDSSHCSYGVLFQRPWESPPSPANSRIRFFSYMRNPKKSSEFFSI